jgi:hypothetical protein
MAAWMIIKKLSNDRKLNVRVKSFALKYVKQKYYFFLLHDQH